MNKKIHNICGSLQGQANLTLMRCLKKTKKGIGKIMEQLNLRYTINSDGSITASWDSISNAVEYSAFMYAEKEA